MFSKILVANRGEVALRIMRAARELGVKTVAVYSTADKDTLPVAYADEAVCIGPAPAGKSYLVMSNIIAAAVTTGCEAVHPGYGFLAENADFARACADNGLVFIGPAPECIERMGNKAAARETMTACGVPTVPGSDGVVERVEDARAFADEVGYPVLIKASAGGGGKGMREVHDPADLESAYTAAKAEAAAAFGNDDVYLEKLVLRPRHIEIQVLADDFGNHVALCERDCSIQRRHQKLLEEAPSPALDDELRAAMGEAAVKAVEAVDYRNAGTIEFLLDESGKFYFMEMNTRVQVEHPVTEQITGTDIIKEQLRIASGEPMSCRRSCPVLSERPRDRVPHQRGRPGERLPSVPWNHHALRRAGRPGHPRGILRVGGFGHLSVLRLHGGQAHRMGPRSRRGAGARQACARRIQDRRHRHHHSVP